MNRNEKMLNYRRKNAGFTLVEVVISLALGGLIMTSVMALFVGFVQAWESKETKYDQFIEQIDGCVRFLSNELKTVTVLPKGRDVGSSAWQLMRLQEAEYAQGERIVLGCKHVCNFNISTKDTEGIKFVVLMHTNEQLIFCYEEPEVVAKRMAEGVETSGNVKISRWILSPYLKKWKFGHFDFEKGVWEFASSLEQYSQRFANKKQPSVFPDGLLLTFTFEDVEEQRFISLMNEIDSSKLDINFRKGVEKGGKKSEA